MPWGHVSGEVLSSYALLFSGAVATKSLNDTGISIRLADGVQIVILFHPREVGKARLDRALQGLDGVRFLTRLGMFERMLMIIDLAN